MGFIEYKDDGIFGCESRTESIVLCDLSDDTRHLKVNGLTKEQVKKEIVHKIRKMAGDFFVNEDIDNANTYMGLAKILESIALSEDSSIKCVEVTYEWADEFVEFYRKMRDK